MVLHFCQASGNAGDGDKGSICALLRNASQPGDCNVPLWCRPAEVPPLHGSGYGWCTDEPKPAPAPTKPSVTTTVIPTHCYLSGFISHPSPFAMLALTLNALRRLEGLIPGCAVYKGIMAALSVSVIANWGSLDM